MPSKPIALGKVEVTPTQQADDAPSAHDICTFCARGLPAFYLQSGTGNLWHRTETGQLYRCCRSVPAPALYDGELVFRKPEPSISVIKTPLS